MADGSDQPKLTLKQEAFVAAYIETGNASEAYRRAYDVSPDCKPNTIEKRACELLQNGKVAGRVAELQARATAKVVLTRSWVLERLMKNAEKGAEISDLTASNKALELLGKTDELQMFIERSSATTDNRHHHSAEPLSPFAQHLADMLGAGAEGPPEKPVQN